jgi:hypothetical protein
MAKNKYDQLFDDADNAFNGLYKKEMQTLKGLSADEIASISPKTQDASAYNALIEVVADASKNNLAQADLIQNIKQLGAVAIKIAKKVPQFAALL